MPIPVRNRNKDKSKLDSKRLNILAGNLSELDEDLLGSVKKKGKGKNMITIVMTNKKPKPKAS